ncbi:MAG: hypothetical protein KA369_06890 [Spirochaetes bacterium]|nr:hypothetical protein [Spirochaetota bacterium]
MQKVKKQMLPFLAGVMALCSCATSGWLFSATKYDFRTARITTRGYAAKRPVRTTLAIECAPGKDGAVTLNYTVFGAGKIEGFDFDAFECPYAPASLVKLADIDVVTQSGTAKYQTAIAGSYTGADDFSFSVSAMNKDRSVVRTIAETLAAGADRIVITVHDMKNRSATVRTEFPAGDAGAAVGKAIRGCCR